MVKILFVYSDGNNEDLNGDIESCIDELGIGRPQIQFCGVDINSETHVSLDLIKWADIIFTFEETTRDELLRQFPQAVMKDLRFLDVLEEDLTHISLLKNLLKRNLS